MVKSWHLPRFWSWPLAAAEACRKNHQNYSEMLSRLSLPQKELLYAVAAEGRATQITSGAFIRKHHLKSASSVQAATKKLMEYHFLSTEAGAYYIEDQLLRLWLMS